MMKFPKWQSLKNILLNLEKRLVLLLFLILLATLLFSNISAEPKQIVVTTLPDKKQLLESARNKVGGKDSWKPKGWGSGEYIGALPIIKAGAVVDIESGEVLWSMNLKEKIAPASLTKLATVLTALDIASSSDIIQVSDEAASQIPTKLGLSQGDKLTLYEAIAGAILTSANDATEAIADDIGHEIGNGTVSFMDLVNTKLARIGAVDSHFETATGLDSTNHYSTVYDLAIIAHAARENMQISEIASKDYLRLEANFNHKLIDLPNWNALLGTYPGVDGLKIGYTEAAGHATIVTAKRDGKSLAAIVVGASSVEDREIGAATLLNFGFSKYGIEAYPVSKLDLVKRFEDWRRQLSYNMKD